MAQSNACTLLENGIADEEIRERFDIAPDVLSLAYAGWSNEAYPLCVAEDAAVEALIENEIGGFLKLTMGRYSSQAQKEFCDQLMVEFAEIPYSLLGPAMAEARRKISFPERLVPFVFDFVEARMNKLRAEGEKLERLMGIARGGQD